MTGNKDAYDIELHVVIRILRVSSEASSSSHPVKCAPLELTNHCHPLLSVIHIFRNALTITHTREKFRMRPVGLESPIPGSSNLEGWEHPTQ